MASVGWAAESAGPVPAAPSATTLPSFDFTQPAQAGVWSAAHQVSALETTPQGLVARIGGLDPYVTGPARDYPAGLPLWLHLRLNSDPGGVCQVFFYRDQPTEENSVRLNVPPGRWAEVRTALPPLGPGYSLRIDPPGGSGACVLGRLWFELRVTVAAPAWPKPIAPDLASNALSVTSGDLRLTHAVDALGAFAVDVAGQRMAVGNSRLRLGYVTDQQVRWLALTNDVLEPVQTQATADGFSLETGWDDPDGAHWGLKQSFKPAAVTGVIDFETRVTVTQAREVVYLPMLTLLPGVGSFGTNKTQGLFAGVEYLENEPSSSQADLAGPASRRQVPEATKITFPLMAIQAESRYVGLSWVVHPQVSAVFDSPDRLFGSGGHLLGLVFPGSDGENRDEGSLLPYRGELLREKGALVVRGSILGGRGDSVVPALEKYVEYRGLALLPQAVPSWPAYRSLAASGWLDSKAREGDLFRHAAWPGFDPQPAADAACWMDWLAARMDAGPAQSRLIDTARRALAQVRPEQYGFAQVGHIRYPLAPLVYGAVALNADQARARARAMLARFQPDGSVAYARPDQGEDYARTHWSREANGLTATAVTALLESALFAGDAALIDRGVALVRAMDKFRGSVPRGAQTWEIPLHTPDILAAAYLVRAYTLAYELTGNAALLASARYWAWTGLPFVYLAPPVREPVGAYSTIAVLGATGWKAPVWIGLPVQWCGLVYGEALYWLARYDADGPWRHVADGIAAAGVQHSYPASDPEYVGLLPDSFGLRSQSRNGPAINPATVLAPALRFYRQPGAYDFRVLGPQRWRVFAPGDLTDVGEREGGVSFTVAAWPAAPCWLLVNGLKAQPTVTLNGKPVPMEAPHQYQPGVGCLILQLQGKTRVEIRPPPQP